MLLRPSGPRPEEEGERERCVVSHKIESESANPLSLTLPRPLEGGLLRPSAALECSRGASTKNVVRAVGQS